MIKKTKTFLYSYYHNNSWWALDLEAYNVEDADDRVKNKLNLAKFDKYVDGNKYRYTYNHDNKDWSFIINADDEKDAQERVNKLNWANYDGELIFRVKAKVGTWFPNLILKILRFFHKED